MADKLPEDFTDSGEFTGYGTRNLPSDELPGDGESMKAESEKAEASAENDKPAEPSEKEEPTSLLDAGKKENPEGDPKPKGDGEAEQQEEKEAAEQAKKDPLDEAITDFSKVDLGLNDFEVDEPTVAAFGETAVRIGLTGRQAKELAQFQLKAMRDARESLTADSMKSLKKDWGKDADANLQKVVNLVNRIDELVGNKEFSTALDKSGASCYDSFAKGMLAVADMLSEDSLGAIQNAGTSKQETALDAIAAAFANAKK